MKILWRSTSTFTHRRRTSISPDTAAASSVMPIPSAPPQLQPPKEFLCPISNRMMADPVILPTGQTFERGCVKACIDLGLEPPPPPFPLPPKDSSFPPLSPQSHLIPNLNLRSTILSWCDYHGINRPSPIDPDLALLFVRALVTTTTTTTNTAAAPPPAPPGPSSLLEALRAVRAEEARFTSPSTITTATTSSSEALPDEPITTNQVPPSSLLEEQIVSTLKSFDVYDQQAALLLLRRETRESKEQRSLLCTQNLLSSLCPFLLSPDHATQSNAAAAIVNLSLHPQNKVPILRSGTVPPLISALKSLHSDIRSHAAAAIFSLSIDNHNKAAIGALGAILPLLDLLSRPNEEETTLRDAALALQHLTAACSTNLSRLARTGAARTLVDIIAKQEVSALGGAVLVVLGNLAGSGEGREALMDAGAVEAVVEMLDRLRYNGNSSSSKDVVKRREQCVGVLFRMSKGSLRFRGLAREAGVEELLCMLVEGEDQKKKGGGEGYWWRTREMAMRTLGAMRGDGYGDGSNDDGTWGTVSDPAMVSRRPRRPYRPGEFTGANSF